MSRGPAGVASGPLSVVGLGNEGMGDDGVGMAVARMLAGAGGDGAAPRVAAGGIDPTIVASLLAEGNRVLVVDAVDMGARPGDWRLFSPEDLASLPRGREVSAHALSLSSIVEMARALGWESRLRVLGIQAGAMAAGAGLSPGVRACLPGVLRRIRREAEDLHEVDTDR